MFFSFEVSVEASQKSRFAEALAGVLPREYSEQSQCDQS
jgi:hypothetical protein